MNKKQAITWWLVISIISWTASWIILSFKLDFLTSIAFILYGLGLSGIIFWILVPQMINLMNEKKVKKVK